jgi:hypothetical protein
MSFYDNDSDDEYGNLFYEGQFTEKKPIELTPQPREPTVVNLNNLDNPKREKYIEKIRSKLEKNRRNVE